MDRTMKKLREYPQDLRSVLELECSREDAKAFGTLREWKSIDRKIRKIERKTRQFQNSLVRVKKSEGCSREYQVCSCFVSSFSNASSQSHCRYRLCCPCGIPCT